MSEKKVATDCCGRLLPESQTLAGDTHIHDLCPACHWRDGREHDRHVTCDWSKDIQCPGRDWTYRDGRVTPAETSAS